MSKNNIAVYLFAVIFIAVVVLVTEHHQLIRLTMKTTTATAAELLAPIPTPSRVVTDKENQNDNTNNDNVLWCPSLRGEYGTWYVDLEYAKATEYIGGFRSAKFRRTHHGRNQFLPQATWAWNETKYTDCQFSIVTLSGLCETLHSMDITRLFMVGDSLQNAMLKSLVGLMKLAAGRFDNREWTPSKAKFYVNKTITCPNVKDFNFEVFFARENPYPNFNITPTTETELMYGHEFAGCGNFKNAAPAKIQGDMMCPWHKLYQQAAPDKRTLLVVNAGAHYHSIKQFENMMDGFVSLMERIDRPNDIVMFRTTVPGHKDCFNQTSSRGLETPFPNYSEYAVKAKTNMYDWNLFEAYNVYVKNVSDRLARSKSPFQMHVLDVFNMTVLRLDGHTSAQDCLHYENPGPIDWWNHLMYSNLLDMAAREARGRTTHASAPKRRT